MTRPGPKRIEVGLAGGLGNQLFQYAAGRALSLQTGADLVLDLTFYREGRHRSFLLDQFSGPAAHSQFLRPKPIDRLARAIGFPGRKMPVYKERSGRPDPGFLAIQPPVRLEGYFQSADYFEKFAATIRQELAPPPATDPFSLSLAETMSGAAALHVRRGDYISNKKAAALYAECLPDYYAAAMEHLPSGTDVVVFSDDIAWAKSHLPQSRHLIFVDDGSERKALDDLWLMSLASHHIIANSSFSWWGAWLATPGQGVTIAPLSWYRDKSADVSWMIPDGWIRLPGQDDSPKQG